MAWQYNTEWDVMIPDVVRIVTPMPSPREAAVVVMEFVRLGKITLFVTLLIVLGNGGMKGRALLWR